MSKPKKESRPTKSQGFIDSILLVPLSQRPTEGLPITPDEKMRLILSRKKTLQRCSLLSRFNTILATRTCRVAHLGGVHADQCGPSCEVSFPAGCDILTSLYDIPESRLRWEITIILVQPHFRARVHLAIEFISPLVFAPKQKAQSRTDDCREQ